MGDSTSTKKEVIEAELSAADLSNLTQGWDGVEFEGEDVIVRLSTDGVELSDRMVAVKEAYNHVYDDARRELEGE